VCRFLAVVASEPTRFALTLREAPRSLAHLSHEHPDGWGLAAYDDDARRWQLDRGTDRAAHCPRFAEIAGQLRGELLIAHVRQKTVGPTRVENSHPFARGRWAFCHNGTIKDTDAVRRRTSATRLAEVEGDTDSELLFAALLTALDAQGLTPERASVEADEAARRDAICRVTAELAEELRVLAVGAFNFLFSDGEMLLAHRFGRSLFVLSRGPRDEVRSERRIAIDAELTTEWTQRRRAIFVASEQVTDEPWREVTEGSLLRVDRRPLRSARDDASGTRLARDVGPELVLVDGEIVSQRAG
jgi:predicted glutamine amidotransferase